MIETCRFLPRISRRPSTPSLTLSPPRVRKRKENHRSTDIKSAGAIMESVTALEQNHRSTDIKSAGAIMESVTALEQNHRSTDIKSAGAAFESGRRDARPTLPPRFALPA
jgi:hypothetical protein